MKEYGKSGEYAEISGNKYIEAGKQAGEKFKGISLTKGYTLKGRDRIRRLDFRPPFNIKMLEKILNGIDDASQSYKMAAEAFPKENQICNAFSVSMSCLSEMLGYMLSVIEPEKVPKFEGEIKNWKGELASCENIYRGNEKGETFIQFLYKLMACIENLNKSQKSTMLTEESAFKEYVEGLGEIAKNIEGPLQKIIEDSAKQMDICRLKIIPYSGIETKFFASSTDISAELKKSYPIEPEIDHEYTPESKLRWRTPLQATGYVRATAPNSVKRNNNPNTI